MSKSRGNVVVPDEYVRRYGADALRLYLMFIGPFDATIAWNDRALHGVQRFLDRVKRLVGASEAGRESEIAMELISVAAGRVGRDIERFHFNTAVAALMECVNELLRLDDPGPGRSASSLTPGILRPLAVLLAPFAPFAAERHWRSLGGNGSVHEQPWPHTKPERRTAATLTVAVQVNGKLRATIEVPPGESQETVETLARHAGTVANHLEEKRVRRVVYVPDRAINFVV